MTPRTDLAHPASQQRLVRVAHPREAFDLAESRAEERWPLPQAAMFLTVAAATSWMLVIALGRWLIGA